MSKVKIYEVFDKKHGVSNRLIPATSRKNLSNYLGYEPEHSVLVTEKVCAQFDENCYLFDEADMLTELHTLLHRELLKEFCQSKIKRRS